MIERTEQIRFHEKGTLEAVTRWITTHADGLAEWLKNVRRQYQSDRANVPDDQRVALLLLEDEASGQPARMGMLDVGGATIEDVTAWSTWQDPEASGRCLRHGRRRNPRKRGQSLYVPALHRSGENTWYS